jgi:hypothetical protein
MRAGVSVASPSGQEGDYQDSCARCVALQVLRDPQPVLTVSLPTHVDHQGALTLVWGP